MMSETASVRFSSSSCHTTIINALDSLLRDETLVDVTLASEGKFLRAHRLILCAYSGYLKELLAVQPEKHPIIFLRDVPFSHVEALIAYMYRGEVDISQRELLNFMKTADSLRIRGLSENCHESPAVCTEQGKQPRETSITRINASLPSPIAIQGRAASSSDLSTKSPTCGLKRLRSESPNATVKRVLHSHGFEEKRIPVVRLTHIDAVAQAIREKPAVSPSRLNSPQPTLPVITSVESVTVMPLSDDRATAEQADTAITKEIVDVEVQLCANTPLKVNEVDMDVGIVTLDGEDWSDAEVQEVSKEEVILETQKDNGSNAGISSKGPKCYTSVREKGELPLHESSLFSHKRKSKGEKEWKTICTETGETRFHCLKCKKNYSSTERVLYHCVRECNGNSRCLCFTCSYKAKS